MMYFLYLSVESKGLLVNDCVCLSLWKASFLSKSGLTLRREGSSLLKPLYLCMRQTKNLNSNLNILFWIGKLDRDAIEFGTWVEEEKELSQRTGASCGDSRGSKSPHLLILVWFPFDFCIKFIEAWSRGMLLSIGGLAKPCTQYATSNHVEEFLKYNTMLQICVKSNYWEWQLHLPKLS